MGKRIKERYVIDKSGDLLIKKLKMSFHYFAQCSEKEKGTCNIFCPHFKDPVFDIDTVTIELCKSVHKIHVSDIRFEFSDGK